MDNKEDKELEVKENKILTPADKEPEFPVIVSFPCSPFPVWINHTNHHGTRRVAVIDANVSTRPITGELIEELVSNFRDKLLPDPDKQ